MTINLFDGTRALPTRHYVFQRFYIRSSSLHRTVIRFRYESESLTVASSFFVIYLLIYLQLEDL